MLDEAKLRKVGFSDPAVINHILNDPTERNRYERELGLMQTTPTGQFNFNLPAEIDKAYSDLSEYYDKILQDAGDDLNLALSRLAEDYDTGKRFMSENAKVSRETLLLASQNLATDANASRKAAETSLVSRGLLRNSQFDKTDPNMGIATDVTNTLEGRINRAERTQKLSEKSFELGQEQQGLALDTNRNRAEQDLRTANERFIDQKAEERKQRAEELASSRAQRAYQRFEAGLF